MWPSLQFGERKTFSQSVCKWQLVYWQCQSEDQRMDLFLNSLMWQISQYKTYKSLSLSKNLLKNLSNIDWGFSGFIAGFFLRPTLYMCWDCCSITEPTVSDSALLGPRPRAICQEAKAMHITAEYGLAVDCNGVQHQRRWGSKYDIESWG